MVANPFLFPATTQDTPGSVLWPIRINVWFSDAPADAVLDLAVTVQRSNITIGESSYLVSWPPDGKELVTVLMIPSLEAVPQTLKVIFEYGGSSSTRAVDVWPGDPHGSPRLLASFTWGSCCASSLPSEAETWQLNVSQV